MQKKRMFIAIGVCVLLLGGWWMVSRKTTLASKGNGAVETAKVNRSTFIKSITSSGKTAADRAVTLRFQTSGLLTWVGVKEGDSVTKGQVIATLDSREVQKSLEKSLHDYAATRNDFEETWRVTYKGIENPDSALTDTVKRVLQKNQWNLEKAVLDVELKHLSYE